MPRCEAAGHGAEPVGTPLLRRQGRTPRRVGGVCLPKSLGTLDLGLLGGLGNACKSASDCSNNLSCSFGVCLPVGLTFITSSLPVRWTEATLPFGSKRTSSTVCCFTFGLRKATSVKLLIKDDASAQQLNDLKAQLAKLIDEDK